MMALLSCFLGPEDFNYWILLLSPFLSGWDSGVIFKKAYFLGQSFSNFTVLHHGGLVVCVGFFHGFNFGT